MDLAAGYILGHYLDLLRSHPRFLALKEKLG
jgi:hypothetical protein